MEPCHPPASAEGVPLVVRGAARAAGSGTLVGLVQFVATESMGPVCTFVSGSGSGFHSPVRSEPCIHHHVPERKYSLCHPAGQLHCAERPRRPAAAGAVAEELPHYEVHHRRIGIAVRTADVGTMNVVNSIDVDLSLSSWHRRMSIIIAE